MSPYIHRLSPIHERIPSMYGAEQYMNGQFPHLGTNTSINRPWGLPEFPPYLSSSCHIFWVPASIVQVPAKSFKFPLTYKFPPYVAEHLPQHGVLATSSKHNIDIDWMALHTGILVHQFQRQPTQMTPRTNSKLSSSWWMVSDVSSTIFSSRIMTAGPTIMY
jgi:hypothetical protein